MLTLYDCTTAPSPRRARILLAEKGLAYETVLIDPANGEQLGERTVPSIPNAQSRRCAPMKATC
jgi:glutathione S-transferase